MRSGLRFAGQGHVYVTAGIAAMSPEQQVEVMRRVHGFIAFTPDNDPHGEHDFGSFEYAGKTIFWKIDCYDRDLNYGSPDPARRDRDRACPHGHARGGILIRRRPAPLRRGVGFVPLPLTRTIRRAVGTFLFGRPAIEQRGKEIGRWRGPPQSLSRHLVVGWNASRLSLPLRRALRARHRVYGCRLAVVAVPFCGHQGCDY